MALAWDSHVHHVAVRPWFATSSTSGWATCPVTESGFVRVSSNPKALPVALGVRAAQDVLVALRRVPGHQFLVDDVSVADPDVPTLLGHRQITDAHLLTLARRRGARVVTFDRGLAALAGDDSVELLTSL